MQTITVPAKTRRAPVLYARLKSENHEWIHTQAKASGYDSASEYVDALFDTLRTQSKVVTAATKEVHAKKTTKARRKN